MKTLIEIHNKQDIITILNLNTPDKFEILKSSIVAIIQGKINNRDYITYILKGNIQMVFCIEEIIID